MQCCRRLCWIQVCTSLFYLIHTYAQRDDLRSCRVLYAPGSHPLCSLRSREISLQSVRRWNDQPATDQASSAIRGPPSQHWSRVPVPHRRQHLKSCPTSMLKSDPFRTEFPWKAQSRLKKSFTLSRSGC
ncbi:hypothetical protein L227DRAFT_227009 [Lentinus tigrinus ALCF2SS1-6]|uniref:Secreted protein n=1 Tax=Lentinus tigrinus ALCF2SS1-6 TaxID=1328759 RepID=A0A5C2S279_9APHY|nr:hypothetical protein L227DRAFT_227009 [Lentinus tigrinus ALCF2SS1-6]